MTKIVHGKVETVRLSVAAAFLSIAVVTDLGVMPAPAQAVTFGVTLGSGSRLSAGRPVGCEEAAGLLRRRGFTDVFTMDCRGRNFVYLAWRGAAQYEVIVRARDGRLIRTRRLR